jgi:hypothetical protein
MWLIIAIPTSYAIMAVDKIDMSDVGVKVVVANGQKTVLLEPGKWVGKKFPLLPFIDSADIREQLKFGDHIIVLFHYNCSKCMTLINHLISEQVQCVVCVEIPPCGNGLNRASVGYVFTSVPFSLTTRLFFELYPSYLNQDFYVST